MSKACRDAYFLIRQDLAFGQQANVSSKTIARLNTDRNTRAYARNLLHNDQLYDAKHSCIKISNDVPKPAKQKHRRYPSSASTHVW
jgi:hypothetical protein